MESLLLVLLRAPEHATVRLTCPHHIPSLSLPQTESWVASSKSVRSGLLTATHILFYTAARNLSKKLSLLHIGRGIAIFLKIGGSISTASRKMFSCAISVRNAVLPFILDMSQCPDMEAKDSQWVSHHCFYRSCLCFINSDVEQYRLISKSYSFGLCCAKSLRPPDLQMLRIQSYRNIILMHHAQIHGYFLVFSLETFADIFGNNGKSIKLTFKNLTSASKWF